MAKRLGTADIDKEGAEKVLELAKLVVFATRKARKERRREEAFKKINPLVEKIRSKIQNDPSRMRAFAKLVASIKRKVNDIGGEINREKRYEIEERLKNICGERTEKLEKLKYVLTNTTDLDEIEVCAEYISKICEKAIDEERFGKVEKDLDELVKTTKEAGLKLSETEIEKFKREILSGIPEEQKSQQEIRPQRREVKEKVIEKKVILLKEEKRKLAKSGFVVAGIGIIISALSAMKNSLIATVAGSAIALTGMDIARRGWRFVREFYSSLIFYSSLLAGSVLTLPFFLTFAMERFGFEFKYSKIVTETFGNLQNTLRVGGYGILTILTGWIISKIISPKKTPENENEKVEKIFEKTEMRNSTNVAKAERKAEEDFIRGIEKLDDGVYRF